jgi:hypothetical protein
MFFTPGENNIGAYFLQKKKKAIDCGPSPGRL